MIRSIALAMAAAVVVVLAFRYYDKKQAEKALGK